MTIIFRGFGIFDLHQKNNLAVSAKGKRSTIRIFKNDVKKEKFFPFAVGLTLKEGTFYW